MSELSEFVWNAIAAAEKELLRITDEQSVQGRDGGWSRREELGHLVDSCVNNHIRFAVAGIKGSFEGPSYDQNEWVDIHGWRHMHWHDLVSTWVSHNRALERVVQYLPPDRLTAKCRIGGGDPVTLEWLIRDYVAHMEQHLSQIMIGIE